MAAVASLHAASERDQQRRSDPADLPALPRRGFELRCPVSPCADGVCPALPIAPDRMLKPPLAASGSGGDRRLCQEPPGGNSPGRLELLGPRHWSRFDLNLEENDGIIR
jgi:hypothetical protein